MTTDPSGGGYETGNQLALTSAHAIVHGQASSSR